MTNLQKQLIIVLGSIFAAGVYLRFNSPLFAPTPAAPATVAVVTTSESGTTDLTMAAGDNASTYLGDEMPIKIAVSGTDHVTGVHLEIVYDPTFLQFESLSASDIFPVTLENAVNDPGKGVITATYGVAVQSGGVTGGNLVAILRFKSIKKGPTLVKFGDSTMVTGTSRTDGTVLKSAGQLGLTIQPPPTSDPSTRSTCKIAAYKMPFDDTTLGGSNSLNSQDYLKPEYRIPTDSPLPVHKGEVFAYGVEVTNTTPESLTVADYGTGFGFIPTTAYEGDFQHVILNSTGCSEVSYFCKFSGFTLAGGETRVLDQFAMTHILQNYTQNTESKVTVKFFGKECGSFTVTTPVAIAGDFSGDGIVSLKDYNILVAGYGNPYTLADYNNLVKNYGIGENNAAR